MTKEKLARMILEDVGIKEFVEELDSDIGDIVCTNISSCKYCPFWRQKECDEKLRDFCSNPPAKRIPGKTISSIARYDEDEGSITCPRCDYKFIWDDDLEYIQADIRFCPHCGLGFTSYKRKDVH